MRPSAKSILVFSLAIAGLGSLENAVADLPIERRNVLFIFIDDLKPKINSFGSVEMVTPNLDAFAESSLSFTRAYCQQSVCGPSRASIMTGLRPDTTKLWGNPPTGTSTREAVDPSIITLPQHFSNNGYRTAGFGKIFHGRSNNAQDGNQSYTEGWTSINAPHRYYGGDATSGNWIAEDGGANSVSPTDAGEFDYRTNPPTPITDEHYQDGLVAEAALTKLQEFSADYLATDQPFFLAVGFSKPHLPFACPKAYWDLYDPNEIDLSDYNENLNLPVGGEAFTAPPIAELTGYDRVNGAPDINLARELIHGYMASVSYSDAQAGKLINALDTIDNTGKLRDNTIVVILGDHGWHLGDHGAFWTKNTNFEEATRTPLIIRTPGMATQGVAGAKCEKPVELVSVYPTLVDLNDLDNPTQPNDWQFDGASLLPLLNLPNRSDWLRPAFSQYHKRISGDGLTTDWGMGYTMKTERFRYTEWYLTDNVNRDVKQSENPEFSELYDHQSDPGETVNLAAHPEYASTVSVLSTTLDGGQGWASLLSDQPTFSNSSQPSVEIVGLDIPNNATILVSGESGQEVTLSTSSDLKIWEAAQPTNIITLNASGQYVTAVNLEFSMGSFMRAAVATENDNGLPPPFNGFLDTLEIYQDGNFMVIETDNIPNHPSPYFATNNPNYEAYNGTNQGYRQNPNSIGAQNLVFRIPINPIEATNKENTRLGPIGVAINGVALFNQYAGPNQPLTNEIDSFDQYNGHPTGGDMYHYHVEPYYITNDNKDGLVGVLLDGFPVYGPVENGVTLTSSDLDEYHGHFGPTKEFPEGIYHYHFTAEDPYLNGGQYFGTPGAQTN